MLSSLSVPRLDYVVVETVSRHGVSTSGSPSHIRRASRQRSKLGAKAHVGSPSWPCCRVQRREILIVLCSPCLHMYHYLKNGLFNMCPSAFGNCEEEILLCRLNILEDRMKIFWFLNVSSCGRTAVSCLFVCCCLCSCCSHSSSWAAVGAVWYVKYDTSRVPEDFPGKIPIQHWVFTTNSRAFRNWLWVRIFILLNLWYSQSYFYL